MKISTQVTCEKWSTKISTDLLMSGLNYFIYFICIVNSEWLVIDINCFQVSFHGQNKAISLVNN